MEKVKEISGFTDRESGIYGGLMLSIRKYRERFDIRHGYELNKKPREIDCLIIDMKSDEKIEDNVILSIFREHNVVEFKNPDEALSIDVLWKVISYATQYKSEERVPISSVSITIIRASKPEKALKMLKNEGYKVERHYPGIYYIEGMVDIKMHIVVTGELEGDDYVALRLQKHGASKEDCRLFVENAEGHYTEKEKDYVEMILKNGLYENTANFLEEIREGKNMHELWKEFFKEDLEEAEKRGEMKMKAALEEERAEKEKAEEEKEKAEEEKEKLRAELIREREERKKQEEKARKEHEKLEKLEKKFLQLENQLSRSGAAMV